MCAVRAGLGISFRAGVEDVRGERPGEEHFARL